MLLEKLLSHPGFLYQIGPSYYYLGKWICSPCTDQEASDCHFMFHMNLDSQEHPEVAYYFLKLRAMCEFALEVPYNPGKIRRDMEELLARLSPSDLELLTRQFEKFQTAWENYGQETIR